MHKVSYKCKFSYNYLNLYVLISATKCSTATLSKPTKPKTIKPLALQSRNLKLVQSRAMATCVRCTYTCILTENLAFVPIAVAYLEKIAAAVIALVYIEKSDIEDNALAVGGGDTPLAALGFRARAWRAVRVARRAEAPAVLLERAPALWNTRARPY